MPLITRFDPWQSSLCTCPPKLTLNPYTGCDHNCIYCYAQSYIPRFAECRPKKDLLKRLKREAADLRGEIVSLSNSSDPYPIMEAGVELTRECLRILSESNCRMQIITKSTLVARDVDILEEASATVAMTVTTEDDSIGKIIEPNAPSPTERLKTVASLSQKGIPVSVRIDPIIPFVNENTAALVSILARVGVRHVTASTYKARLSDWRRLVEIIPDSAAKLKSLYWIKGERAGGCRLLPRDLRLKLLSETRRLVLHYGMEFAVCREGLSQLNTTSCDGSWMIQKLER